MSELDLLSQASLNVADKVSTEVLLAFQDSYTDEIDLMFARLHAEGTGDVNLNYNYEKKNYRRVALKSREDTQAFVNFMRHHGIHVVATAHKYNGQYLAEIQYINEVPVNANEESSDDTVRINANTLIEQFQNETQVEIEKETPPEYANPNQQHYHPDMMGLLTNHMDTLGTVIHEIDTNIRKLEEYGVNDLQTSSIFEKDLDAHGNAIPHVNAGKSKTAVVINNNIVMIDGKVVKDAQIRDDILQQHSERIREAQKIVSQSQENLSSNNRVIREMSQNATEHRREFQAREEERKRKFDAEETRRLREHNANETRRRKLFDTSEEQRKQKIMAENAERAVRGEPEIPFVPNTFTETPFVPRTFQPATYQPLQQGIEDFYDKQTKNAESILQNVYRQEYVVSDYHEVNSERKNSQLRGMEQTLSRINTDAVVLNELSVSSYINAHEGNILSQIDEDANFSMNATARRAIRKLRRASEREELANLSAWERQAIVAVTADYVKVRSNQLDYVEDTIERRLEKIKQTEGKITELESEIKKLKNAGASSDVLKEKEDTLTLLKTNLNTQKTKVSDLQDKLNLEKKKLEDFSKVADMVETQFEMSDEEFQAFKQAKANVESLQQFQMAVNGVKEINFSHDEVKAFHALKDFGSTMSGAVPIVGAVEKAILGGAKFTNAERRELLSKIDDYIAEVSAELKTRTDEIAEMKTAIAEKERHLPVHPTSAELTALETEKETLRTKESELIKDKTEFQSHQLALKQVKSKISLTEGEQKLETLSQQEKNSMSEKIDSIMDKISSLEELTIDDMLDLQEAFIKKAEAQGFQFVTVTGNFDVKALEKLTPAQMEQLGINENMRNLLLKAGDANLLKNQFYSDMGSLLAGTFKKFDDSEDWQEIRNLYSKGRQVKDYAIDSYTAVYRLKEATARKVESLIAKTETTATGAGTAEAGTAVNGTGFSANSVNSRRNERFLAKQRRKKARLDRFNNTRIGKVYNKVNTFKEQTMKRILESKAGQFVVNTKKFLIKIGVKLAAYAGIASFITAFFLVTAVVVITSIQSLMDTMNPSNIINNMLAAKTYEDTVAYNLYSMMKADEDSWLKLDISNFTVAYNERDKRKYGDAYIDYVNYINGITDLQLGDDEKTIYINPFLGGSNSSVKLDDLTKVESFDGNNAIALRANTNLFTKSSEGDAMDFEASGQNGHTSNIKDIIAMTDIMFGMALDENDDLTATSILGETEGTLNWNRSSIAEALKWIGAKVTGADYEWKTKEERLSYEMIEQYAGNLFDASHQQNATLSVEYYTPVPEGNGTFSDNGSQTDVASKLGVCVHPTKKNFKIDWNSGNIAPYITKEDDSKLLLTDGGNSIIVSMENCADWYNGYGTAGDNPEGCCLWNGLSGEPNSNTEYWIQRNANLVEGYSGGSGCWELESESKELDSPYTFSAGHYTWTGDNPDDGWYIGDAHTWDGVDYANCDELIAGRGVNKVKSIYESLGDKDTEYHLSNDRNYLTVIRYTKSPISYDINDYRFDTHSDISKLGGTDDELGGYVHGSIVGVSGSTAHEYKFTYYRYIKSTTVYKRECKGHEFQYCGGHIAVHSNGIVYSMTNEQLLTADLYNNDLQKPIAENFDLEEKGYSELIGKVIPEKVDTTTLQTFVSVPVGISPVDDVQGSTVTSTYGMNLNCVDNVWQSENAAQFGNDDAYRYHIRDIFDIDMSILKGSKAFPIGKKEGTSEYAYEKYEGWTADNMFLAISRVTSEWADYYGFDIPYEIGTDSLSSNDIANICDALEEAYDGEFTDERKSGVELALTWVGRGHYSDTNDEHSFLKTYHQGNISATNHNDFSVNCTASSDAGFVDYVLSKALGANTNMRIPYGATEYAIPAYGKVNSLDDIKANRKPCDVITHKPISVEIDELNQIIEDESSTLTLGKKKDYLGYTSLDSLRQALSHHAMLYIGTPQKRVELSTGEVLEANEPLFVDMSVINGQELGTVFLLNTKEKVDKESESPLDEVELKEHTKLPEWLTGTATDPNPQRAFYKSFT